MNPSVRMRHRFGRSGAFDLRRKVLLKNFLRKHQLITEALEDDMNLTESKEEENVTESDVHESSNSYVSGSPIVEEPAEEPEGKVPSTDFATSEADPKPEDERLVEMDMEIDQTVAQDSKVEKKLTMCQKLRKFLAENQHSCSQNASQNSDFKSEENCENADETEHDSFSDASYDDRSPKKLKLDTNGDISFPLLEEFAGRAKNLEEKTNTPTKRKHRFSFRRPYSFSKQKQNPLESPENPSNGRLTRSMVRKRSWHKQKKSRVKSCLKQLLSKERDIVTTAPIKSKKTSRFLIKLFPPKNPAMTVEHKTDFSISKEAISHESDACNMKRRAQPCNPSVSVQTLLTCFPDADVPTGGNLCIDNSVFDKFINSVPVGKDGYWLRSCHSPERSRSRILRSSNFPLDRHVNWNQPVRNRNLQVSKNLDNISTRTRSCDSKELPRSKSVHEKAVNKPSVCRRVKSVYVPRSDFRYSEMHQRL